MILMLFVGLIETKVKFFLLVRMIVLLRFGTGEVLGDLNRLKEF